MADHESVEALLAAVESDRLQVDARELVSLATESTGAEPVVWNGNTIGFGRYHYRYESGQEGEFFRFGIALRRDRITLYVMSGLRGFDDILERLGPHKASKSAIHLKSLDDVDRTALEELVVECDRHLGWVETTRGAIPRMSEIPPREPPSTEPGTATG